ncbi:MAG: hypothetical protein AB7P99_12705 [Vicinamibacterales bacterium]|uniref:hypothetical protein n=1 Tax=Ramlibacter sp. TaxID=1917967 RepID=UPI003D115A24
MIKSPTLFVLGAGASKPFGYPTGAELRAILCSASIRDSDGTVYRKLVEAGNQPAQIKEFTNAFERSGFVSIDRFLALRQDFASTGRAAIAAAISECNSEWRLYRTAQSDGKYVPGTSDWYSYLWERMTAGAANATDVMRENKVSFITFNYDRSLERFLLNSLTYGFGADSAQSSQLLSEFPIHHVYGSLARKGQEDVHNDGMPPPQVLREFAENIRVMPNQRPDEDPRCLEMFNAADQVFFLGFGFDEMNCMRLGLGQVFAAKSPRVFATCLKQPKGEVAVIRSRFGKTTAGMALDDTDCLGVLRSHAHRLR